MGHIILDGFRIPAEARVSILWEGPNNRWNHHAETTEGYVEKFQDKILDKAKIFFLAGGISEYSGNVWDFVDGEYPVPSKFHGEWESIHEFLRQSAPCVLQDISQVTFEFKSTTLKTYSNEFLLEGLEWGRENSFFEVNQDEKVEQRVQMLQRAEEERLEQERLEQERLERIRAEELAVYTCTVNRAWSNFMSAGDADIECTAAETVSLLASLWDVFEKGGCMLFLMDGNIHFEHTEGTHHVESLDTGWLYDSGHFSLPMNALEKLPPEHAQSSSVVQIQAHFSS